MYANLYSFQLHIIHTNVNNIAPSPSVYHPKLQHLNTMRNQKESKERMSFRWHEWIVKNKEISQYKKYGIIQYLKFSLQILITIISGSPIKKAISLYTIQSGSHWLPGPVPYISYTPLVLLQRENHFNIHCRGNL